MSPIVPGRQVTRAEYGRQGEALAERRLIELGFRRIDRCCRSRLGEIDLVMQDGETLVFVEVKARASGRFGFAEEAVGPRKQLKLARLAAAYVRSRGLEGRPIRFDVVAIQGGEIRHVPDAFRASGYAW